MGRKKKREACDLYYHPGIHPFCPWLVPVVGVEGWVDGAHAFDVIGPEKRGP